MARADKHVAKVYAKDWGWEEWVYNGDYCGKVLVFTKLLSTSMHYHVVKHETMRCLDGKFRVDFLDPAGKEYSVELSPGESVVINPGQAHRIVPLEIFSSIVEFSTHHEDSDSVRIGPRVTG